MYEKILVVDDEEIVRSGFTKVLAVYNFTPIEAADGPTAIQLLQKEKPSVVLLDLKLGDENGIDVLQQLLTINPGIPIIMITAHGTIETAVEAIKFGAYDFVTKPPDFDRLTMIIKRAIETRELKNQVKLLDSELEGSMEGFLGKSEAMKSVIEQIRHIVRSNLSVILQGETGTGKTYIAGIMHSISARSDKPFIKVDIGSIAETLVESELYGYEKGAFTGADKKKVGFFERAHSGTIFLDEIENMSSNIQTKLLTVVEEKELYRLGGTKPVHFDVQLISATNSDIKKNVAEKRFREDLLYRLGEFIVTIPPLRNRQEDIPFLAHHFLVEANAEMKKHIIEISNQALDLLTEYSWPGNVRELKTVVKKAVIYCETNTILPKHILSLDNTPPNIVNQNYLKQTSLTFKQAVENTEKESIKQALIQTKYNKTQAANILQLNYKTLLRKMKEYHLDNPIDFS